MNRTFHIQMVMQGLNIAKGKGGTLYTVKFKGANLSELDKFVNCEHCRKYSEFDTMIERLNVFTQQRGFPEEFFKQKKYRKVAPTCPYHERGKLRMYCCRYGKVALIAGNGGPKLVRTIQEDPVLLEAFNAMVYVGERVEERIRSKDLRVTDKGLEGDSEAFYFEQE